MRIDGKNMLIDGARLLRLAAFLALASAWLGDAAPSAAAVRSGGPGADFLSGTPRADRLLGRGGNDSLFGGRGRDTLVGGPGVDRIWGEAGADRLRGGSGNDWLLAQDGAVDRVDCGRGLHDAALVDAVDRVAPSCERVDGAVADQPPAPGPATPPASASAVQPAQPEPEPEDEPVEEPAVEFEEQPLAMFPPGHGWTGNGFGSFDDAGPPVIVNGDRSFRIVTNGLGDPSVASSPPLDPIDLTRSHVSVQAEVSFSSRLETVKLRLASGDIASDYAEATVWREDFDPVILGTSFEFQSLPLGSFDVVGDVDWSAIDRAQILLADNEAGPVTLYTAGIYAVKTSHRAIVSFAFDDGHDSVFSHGLKKLSAYRYPASTYVIANTVGEPNVLSLEQLYKLRNQHHWEIGGHSFTLAAHNLPNGLDDLEPGPLKAEMDGLREWLDEHGFKRESFAYPKGGADQLVRQYAARDYCTGRVTARGPETLPTRDNYTVRGWSINGLETDGAEVEAAIDRAAADGTWLILSFHDIVDGAPALATEFDYDEFAAVVDHVRALQKQGAVRVRTVGDAARPYCHG